MIFHSPRELNLTSENMGQALIRYEYDSQIGWGLLTGDRVTPLEGSYPDLDAVLEQGDAAIEAAVAADPMTGLERSAVTILAPATAPAKILCQSPNFKEEDAEKEKKAPHSFFIRKDDSSLGPATGEIHLPEGRYLIEGSVTLGLVIGKEIFRPMEVTEENIHEFVKGWIICTDLMARDQFAREDSNQLYQSKSYRGFCPTGPIVFLPSADDWKLLNQMEMRMWVNNELKEENFTRLWRQHPAQSLTELSKVIDLAAGDLLLTGGSPISNVSPPTGMIQRIGGLLFSEEKRMSAFFQSLAKEGNYLQKGDSIRTTITSADGTISLGEQRYSIATS